jgi:ferredoxin
VAGLSVAGLSTALAAVPNPVLKAGVEVHGCQGCGACLLTCPEHAIRPVAGPSGPARLFVLAGLCTGCGDCVEVCPVDAITFTSATFTSATFTSAGGRPWHR